MTEHDVKLFTHSGCADSPKVRAWLQAHHIAFIERVVDDDPDVVEELKQTGHFVTPLVLWGNDHVIGYRPQRLQDLFGVTE